MDESDPVRISLGLADLGTTAFSFAAGSRSYVVDAVFWMEAQRFKRLCVSRADPKLSIAKVPREPRARRIPMNMC